MRLHDCQVFNAYNSINVDDELDEDECLLLLEDLGKRYIYKQQQQQ